MTPSRTAPRSSAGKTRTKRIIRERSGGVCEACGSARATNGSHRIGAGVGGLWCPSNVLDFCGSGTTGCHGLLHSRPAWARLERGWRLESTDDPAAMPFLHAWLGWVVPDVDGGLRQVDEVWALAALTLIFRVDNPL